MMFAVGIMSGTSLDGVDVVLLEISGSKENTKLKVLADYTLDMPITIRNKIKKACVEELSSVDLICSLNFELGYLFSDAVKEVCKRANFPLSKLDYVASHGQTIYHLPKDGNGFVSSTLQIGEPAVIAYALNTTVVSNFRVMDMAAKGQGAPLVPYSEYILYGQSGKNIALQNIGGIGNVTVLPASNALQDVFAFDSGPGNMMINEACQILFQLEYDQGGLIASSGSVCKELSDELMQHPYMHKVPPKSTGREEFGEVYVKQLLKKYSHIAAKDIITTFTMFTATSMYNHYQRFIMNKMSLDQIIISGGGSHNTCLMKFIKEVFTPIEVVTQEDLGYSSDAKEAIAFAILGNETMHGNYSNVISATGAKEYVILGNITPKPIREEVYDACKECKL